MCLKLTGVEEDVLVALVLRAGADKELGAHALPLLHLTLAVVVILQDQAVQLVESVVADCVDGEIVALLPPGKEKKHTGNTAIYWTVLNALDAKPPFQISVLP